MLVPRRRSRNGNNLCIVPRVEPDDPPEPVLETEIARLLSERGEHTLKIALPSRVHFMVPVQCERPRRPVPVIGAEKVGLHFVDPPRVVDVAEVDRDVRLLLIAYRTPSPCRRLRCPIPSPPRARSCTTPPRGKRPGPRGACPAVCRKRAPGRERDPEILDDPR